MSTPNPPPPFLAPLPSKSHLLSLFSSKRLSSLRTPALVLDRSKFISNSERMTSLAASWSARFRAHIKTLKTVEGTRVMLDNSAGTNHAIIVSTLAEAWGVVGSSLVSDGLVQDLPELALLRETMQSKSPRKEAATLRLMIDHPAHVEAINATKPEQPWSVFVKVDCGYARAGQRPESAAMDALLRAVLTSPHVSLFGLYSHGGHSYATSSASEAGVILSEELDSVKRAAEQAQSILSELKDRVSNPLSLGIDGQFVLSVGSTPTAHAASTLSEDEQMARLKRELSGVGTLELHAGNYSCLDLQQVATHAMPRDSRKGEGSAKATGTASAATSGGADIDDVSLSVLCEIVGLYPGRGGQEGCDEAMCDAGGLALSKDTGPWGGYGHVVHPATHRGWEIAKVSQEHGVLRVRKGDAQRWRAEWGIGTSVPEGENGEKSTAKSASRLEIPEDHRPSDWRVGDRFRVIPQHACMVAAAHPWIYVFDSSGSGEEVEEDPQVVDVWVPFKGW